jgi:hypothetical protein
VFGKTYINFLKGIMMIKILGFFFYSLISLYAADTNGALLPIGVQSSIEGLEEIPSFGPFDGIKSQIGLVSNDSFVPPVPHVSPSVKHRNEGEDPISPMRLSDAGVVNDGEPDAAVGADIQPAADGGATFHDGDVSAVHERGESPVRIILQNEGVVNDGEPDAAVGADVQPAADGAATFHNGDVSVVHNEINDGTLTHIQNGPHKNLTHDFLFFKFLMLGDSEILKEIMYNVITSEAWQWILRFSIPVCLAIFYKIYLYFFS